MKTKLDLSIIRRAAEVLKCLSHPQRLRIVDYLEGREVSVGELMKALSLDQVSVSKQLAVLKKGGVVDCRVSANFRLYSIRHLNVLNILKCIRRHGGKKP